MADEPELDIVGLAEKVEALLIAVKSLENRMLAVERAIPWQAPKLPKPPKLPPKRPYQR